MQLIDVHAHLDFDDYKDDLDAVIQKNKDSDVKFVINNGVDVKSNRKTLELAEKYDLIKPALGIYPTHILEMTDEEIEQELQFIEQQDIIAIGECGLDYFLGPYSEHKEELTEERKEKMKNYLRKFVALAMKKNIPIIVHSRKAELEVVELLEDFDYKKIVMHCFSGRKHLIKRIIENKWYLSIPCNIIKSEHFQNIVTMAPIAQLFTETDAPFISPYPDIRRNEPRFVIETIKKMAEIKGMDPEEVANNIFMNYQNLFL